jgi:hypothetical protein
MSSTCDPGQLRWEPHFPGMDSIWYLMLGTDQLARVARRVDAGWTSEVARHRRDWRRRPVATAPSRPAALRWAEAWTRANFDRILEELPPLWRTQCGVLTMASLEHGAEPRRWSSVVA